MSKYESLTGYDEDGWDEFEYEHWVETYEVQNGAGEVTRRYTQQYRRPSWDEYFLEIARAVSLRSDCERDKVGAVVVAPDKRIRATGYNGAPSGDPGCDQCPRRTSGCRTGSDYSNCIAVHAEANALLYCDRADLIGATLYVTRQPCYACSKLIAGAGIERVVTPSG